MVDISRIRALALEACSGGRSGPKAASGESGWMGWFARQGASQRRKCLQLVAEHYTARGWQHAYRQYADLVRRHVHRGAVVADVGCGRSFEMAQFLLNCGARPHGIDPLGTAQALPPGAVLKVGSVYDIPYEDARFDLIITRSALEHLEWPQAAFREFHRVLRPTGRMIFLTANRYDYASLGAMLVPNAFHGKLVKWMEGRDESDTFPTFYRANSTRALRRLAETVGLHIESLEYYNNYPSYLMFNTWLCRMAIAYDELIRRVSCLCWLQAWIIGVLTKQPLAQAFQAPGQDCSHHVPAERYRDPLAKESRAEAGVR